MKRYLLLLVIVPVVPTFADEGGAIATMDDLRFRAPKEKGEAAFVAGEFGRAVRFRFDQDAKGVFMTRNIHGTRNRNRAAGFLFRVKMDGGDGSCGHQFIFDADYAVRYDLCFPVLGTGWTRVTVSWRDLIPILPGPRARPLGTPGGNPPSRITGLWFGRWWYWRDYPATTFAIDEIRLEPKIERDVNEYSSGIGEVS